MERVNERPMLHMSRKKKYLLPQRYSDENLPGAETEAGTPRSVAELWQGDRSKAEHRMKAPQAPMGICKRIKQAMLVVRKKKNLVAFVTNMQKVSTG
ncbi:hypothetical protein R1flu_027040 [Riccia fluitans]|uniref:Uncharacterized protein n=1 Tax=Riccia fluitans TaxID=41844 RepID=A0ABD1XHM3_9MARC